MCERNIIFLFLYNSVVEYTYVLYMLLFQTCNVCDKIIFFVTKLLSNSKCPSSVLHGVVRAGLIISNKWVILWRLRKCFKKCYLKIPNNKLFKVHSTKIHLCIYSEGIYLIFLIYSEGIYLIFLICLGIKLA